MRQAASELSEELVQSEKNELASTGAEDSTTLDTIARRLAMLIYQALGCEKVSIIVVEPGTGELRSIAFAGITAEQEQRRQQWTVEHMARVQVRDEGPGLPETEQQRVWERFYRSEGIEVSSGSAVGLGLHISRTIIEMQGGQVSVDSTPGQGSVFWFTLPQVRT